MLYKLSIIVIVCVTVLLRSYRIGEPVADWHSWRQADTAAVARNFVDFGIDPLRPRYDDVSNIASGKDNPEGYRMVEFPLYQMIAAPLAMWVPSVSIEVWLRIVTIVSASITALVLTLLVSAVCGRLAGVGSGAVYAVLPYSMYYGRTILPETHSVMWALISLYAVLGIPGRAKKGSVTRSTVLVIFSSVAAALAFLVKPTAGFLLLPVVPVLFARFGASRKFFVSTSVFAAIALTPLLLWRRWILHFPEGIPAYTWLLNANNIRFKGAWFHWLFAKRIGELMLGFWGLIPFGLGIISRQRKQAAWFVHTLGAGSLLYLVIFATGNVQHDYYQILLLPAVSTYMGLGLSFLLRQNIFSRVFSYGLAGVSIIFALAFSWYQIRTYYWINRPDIVEAGMTADQMIPKDAKVIAPYNGDTTFLYQTRRRGWPLGFDIDKKIAMGATHYVTVSPNDADTETKQLVDCFTVLVRNDRYAIIDLTRPIKPCTITNP